MILLEETKEEFYIDSYKKEWNKCRKCSHHIENACKQAALDEVIQSMNISSTKREEELDL